MQVKTYPTKFIAFTILGAINFVTLVLVQGSFKEGPTFFVIMIACGLIYELVERKLYEEKALRIITSCLTLVSGALITIGLSAQFWVMFKLVEGLWIKSAPDWMVTCLVVYMLLLLAVMAELAFGGWPPIATRKNRGILNIGFNLYLRAKLSSRPLEKLRVEKGIELLDAVWSDWRERTSAHNFCWWMRQKGNEIATPYDYFQKRFIESEWGLVAAFMKPEDFGNFSAGKKSQFNNTILTELGGGSAANRMSNDTAISLLPQYGLGQEVIMRKAWFWVLWLQENEALIQEKN